MKALKKIIALLLLSLLLAAVSGGASAYFYYAIEDKTKETADLLEKASKLAQKQALMNNNITLLKGEKESIDKLNENLIKESEIVNFTKRIEELGPLSNTILSLESLDRSFTEKSVPYLSFRIKATGKFSDVMRLMALFENFPGRFDWKSVRLTRNASTDPKVSSAQWQVELYLTALNYVR